MFPIPQVGLGGVTFTGVHGQLIEDPWDLIKWGEKIPTAHRSEYSSSGPEMLARGEKKREEKDYKFVFFFNLVIG